MITNKILFSMLVMSLVTGIAGAVTLNVGPGQTYSTIQSAVDVANTGDVVSVNEGTYTENLVVRKNGVTLLGKNKEKTIIDGQKTGSVVRIETNNVIISGFTIKNNGGSGKDDAGVSLYSANNNMIANSIITDNAVGISLYLSNNNIISGNYISSNGRNGIFIYSSNDNRIYNNNIQGNQIGIYADSAKTSRIYSNNLIDNRDQAYDNSDQNSWDEGKSGNYWSNYKGQGAYKILGGTNAGDNYPLSGAVTIKFEPVPTPAETKTQQNEQEAGKSSPGFTGALVLFSLIMIAALKNTKRE